MKQKFIIITTALLSLSMVACMDAPKGDKADTTDTFAVSEKITGDGYSANLESSTIDWLGTKPTGTHWGTVKLSDGVIYVDKNKVTGGKLTIDLNSIVVLDLEDPDMNGKLLGHLKSADFFHVDSFPKAYFEIAQLENYSDTTEANEDAIPTHLVKGNLTMRGVTKGISFPAQIEINEDEVTVKTSQFLINRTLWNVNYGSKSIFAELKDNFIHDEMGIKINFTAVKK